MSIRNTVLSIRVGLSNLLCIPESDLTDTEFNQWSKFYNQWGECLNNATGQHDIPVQWGNWITHMLQQIQPRMIAFAKRKDDEEAQ